MGARSINTKKSLNFQANKFLHCNFIEISIKFTHYHYIFLNFLGNNLQLKLGEKRSTWINLGKYIPYDNAQTFTEILGPCIDNMAVNPI